MKRIKNLWNRMQNFYSKKIKKNKNKFTLRESIIFMLISFAFGLVIGGAVMFGKGFFGHHTTTSMNEFIGTYNDLVNSYYQEVDEDKLLESGINGMLKYLGDPYTVFMPSKDAEEFNESVEGIYYGIGAQIRYDDSGKKIIIDEVFENSPAKKAGLLQNDILIKVNDEDVSNMSTSKVASIVKGEKGTSVNLTVEREGKEISLDIIRGEVDNISVSGKIIEKDGHKIGYLSISIFAANTYDQFKTELEKLENDGMESLIIDVRGNSGGYLTTVTDVISMFIKKGETIYQLKTKDKIEVINDDTNEHRDYKIVVLTNSGSASASEVLIGALKETYGAKIVGTKTFGKGKVQKLYTLSSGAIVKYTYQEWLTPKGNYIDVEGITPDYEIAYQLDKNLEDNQLEKALSVIMEEE